MKESSQYHHREASDPDAVISFFETHKFDESLETRFMELTDGDPRQLFKKATLDKLKQLDSGARMVLLAHASLYITTRPSDMDIYLQHFPEDMKLMEMIVSAFSNRPPDGITLTFVGLLANRSPESNRNAQLSEIYERRELAPDFLLTGYEHDIGTDCIEKEFGEAARGYIEASREAHELEFAGDRPFERRTPFDTPEFEAMEESEKSRMLRFCLGGQQLSLVFNEALNSAFTPDFVERQKIRFRESQLLICRHYV